MIEQHSCNSIKLSLAHLFYQQTHIPGGHSWRPPCNSPPFESHVSAMFSPEGTLLDICCPIALWLLERDGVEVDASVLVVLLVLEEDGLGVLPLTASGTLLSFSETQGRNPGGHSLTSKVGGNFLLFTGKLCPKFVAKRMKIVTLITNMTATCWAKKGGKKKGNLGFFFSEKRDCQQTIISLPIISSP